MMEAPRPDGSVLYLARRAVKLACTEIDAVECVRTALRLHARGQAILPEEAYLSWPTPAGGTARSLSMPGLLAGTVPSVGVKVINANPVNVAHGLERASGLILLLDPETARVACILDAAVISALRTAAVTALVADLLRGPSVACLALIGAGALARHHLEVLPDRLPHLREVRLFDIERARADALAAEARRPLAARNVTVMVTEDAEAAVRPAQLVVLVTTTTRPYLRLHWLHPGAILVNVSLDDAEPEVLLSADLLLVDDWQLVKGDQRRLLGRMYRDGRIGDPLPLGSSPTTGPRHVDGELGQVLMGDRPGRRRLEDVVVVNPFGLAIEDIAVATRVYEIARGAGLGQVLER